ncbi:hypothetical protein O181_109118 [Austropuccinia psidii MF-1]|uniref:HAT C-terminal dimerisation domain-containing protein n=1 Tax=Austropuccinia psidii MF-1 TaxID=1389203 RepID=A0A9Q3PPI4_9BASI|nr:hypothetical protein [Austropuccinia psidii MF-1]
MINRAWTLKDAYHHLCSTLNLQYYILSAIKWEKVKVMIDFLHPLNEATHIICGSKYPTINHALPLYILLIKCIQQATLQLISKSSKELQEQFENEAQKHFTNAENVPSSTQADMAPSGIYDELYESSTQNQSSLENELNRFLVETSEPKSTDVLVFWKTQRHLFPTLGKMAQKFLSIPATSAPSERILSIGRKISTFQQASLSPMHVEKLA